MELILKAMLLVGAVICAWAAYKVIHEYIIENRKGTPNEPEPPYKIEPPKSTEQLAVPLPHKPIEWTFANAPEPKPKRGRPAGSKNKPREHLRVVPPNAKPFVISVNELRIAKRLGLTAEQYVRERIEINKKESSKPKRKYTKRSKYWSSPKVKTKMSKARKARTFSKSK